MKRTETGVGRRVGVGAPRAAWPHALALAAAMLTASCACTNPRPQSSWDGPPPKSAAAAQGRQASSSSKLRRPDLPPGWNWNGQAIPTGDPETSVIKLEKFAPATVGVGADYEYRVRVTNIGSDVALEDVTVRDRLPGGSFAFASANPAGERSGDQIAWKFGRLAPGESRDIVVSGRAAKAGPMGGFASVTYAPQVGVETIAVAPAVTLQRFAPDEVVQCDEIPLRYVVTNSGTGPASRVKVVDELPEGWAVDGRRTLTFEFATLKAGESKVVRSVAKASTTGEFVGRCKLTADGGIEATAESKTAVRRPKLEITRAAAAPCAPGDDAVLEITVKNTGDCAARDLRIEDAIEGADRVTAVSDGGAAGKGKVRWMLGSLAAGESRSVKLTVKRSAAGTVNETVTATAYGAETATSPARTAFGSVPEIALEVAADADTVAIDGAATYTIKVTNDGTGEGANVVVGCALDSTVEYVSGSGATAARRDGYKVTFEPLATLAPKASATWTVRVRGVKEGEAPFRVTVATNGTGMPIERTVTTRVAK